MSAVPFEPRDTFADFMAVPCGDCRLPFKDCIHAGARETAWRQWQAEAKSQQPAATEPTPVSAPDAVHPAAEPPQPEPPTEAPVAAEPETQKPSPAPRASDEQAAAFAHLFRGNNTTAHYVHGEDGTGKGWYRTEKRGVEPADIARHLGGAEPSLLSIPILPSGNCHFADGDVDCHGADDKPVDHAALARRITELQLPLVVTRSRRAGGAHLTLFFKEQEGCPAPVARRLVARYLAMLGLKGEIFPKQSDGPEALGSGINLPYFGADRIAFGRNGEELGLTEFLQLAQERRSFGSVLEQRDLTVGDSSGEPRDDRPLRKSQILKLCKKAIRDFKKAPKGERNKAFNTATYASGRAFAAGVLSSTEDETKTELTKIALKIGLDIRETDATLRSGWDKGKANPYKVLEIDATGGIVYEPGYLNECVEASEKVLHDIAKKYFERNLELVSPVYARDVKADEGISRDDNSLLVQNVSRATIIRDLDVNAVYLTPRAGKDGDREYRRTFPPGELAVHIIDRVRANTRDIPYPALDMVVNTPVLLPSGEVHDTMGEYREGILFIASSRKFPRVNPRPTQDQARSALDRFKPLFEKFPFTGADRWHETPSYSTVLAGILTVVSRPALPAAVPLIAVKAPRQRSGKTKIVETITTAALGHKPTTVDFTDEEEFAKHLLPLLRQQDRVVSIDNIERPLRGSKLAITLTSSSFNDRILGESQTIRLTNRAVFFATGNNLVISGDLAYRALLVSIDPNVERPEERKFDFDPPCRAAEQHPELVAAALTALRAYTVAGRPWALKRPALGGFEDWDRLVSGCLTWLDYADPVETRHAIIGNDPERDEQTDLLRAWYADFRTEITSLFEIERKPLTETHRMLLSKNGWEPHVIKWRLRRLLDRIEGGLKLVRVDEGRAGRFRIVVVDGSKLAPRDLSQEELPY